MLNGEGRNLEDLRQIRNDWGLREVLGLRRRGVQSGFEGLGKVNRKALKGGLKYEGVKGNTLDIDATRIEAEKHSAKMTYTGYVDYMPMVRHLAENGLIFDDEFQQSNEAHAVRNLEFMNYREHQLPIRTHIKAFRADNAAYQAKIMNYCNDNEIDFAIGANLDQAVVSQIKSLSSNYWQTYQNGFNARRCTI